MGMSAALGRDAVPIGEYLAGSLLTLMCRPGRGCKRTAGSSATVTRRCLRRPFLAPGPRVSDHATVTSFLCYLPEQRLGSHTEEETCKQMSRMERAGALWSVLAGLWPFLIPCPETRCILLSPLFQWWVEYLPTNCLTERNLTSSPSPPPCSVAEMANFWTSCFSRSF